VHFKRILLKPATEHGEPRERRGRIVLALIDTQ
jgi:hypothetical protein